MRAISTIAAVGLAALSLLGGAALAQNSSLFHQDLPNDDSPGLKVSTTSWLFQRVDPPAQVKLHDIIRIIVKEGSSLNSQGQVDRRKTGVFNAQLKNWVLLRNLNLEPAPMRSGQPQANGTLDQEYQADTQLQTKDSLNFVISAEIVDIRPNGNFVVEAHQHIQINEDIWDKSLSGVFRRQDVLPNNTVLSENIAELSIDKREVGHVRDGYRRGWLTRLYDRFSIF